MDPLRRGNRIDFMDGMGAGGDGSGRDQAGKDGIKGESASRNVWNLGEI